MTSGRVAEASREVLCKEKPVFDATKQYGHAIVHDASAHRGSRALGWHGADGARLPIRAPARFWLASMLFLTAHPAVMADETKVFEWRGAGGVVSFSNVAPPAGTKGVTSREIDTVSLTPARRVAIAAQLARIDAAEEAAADRFERLVDKADRNIDSALARLHRAEAALRAGRAPKAGERIGTEGPHSRLRLDYFERQDQLAATAQAARENLTQAYRQRDTITP